MGSRVLTTMTVGLARWAMASGRAPNSDPPASPGGAEAPITTRSARSASRRIAVRTLAVSRSSGSERAVTNWRMNAASARSAWARTASVTPAGTRCMTTTVAPWRSARASATRSASSAWGPPRTGTRIRRMSRAPRCLTTAMSHGDSRTTSSIVGLITDALGSRWGPDLPPQPKIMRSASCSAAASTMPAAAWRPMRTSGWMTVPSGT